MTADKILEMAKAVDEAKKLLGSITILKERIAWLEANEPLYIAFDRGASKPSSVGVPRVELTLDGETMQHIRQLLFGKANADLTDLQDRFAKLQFQA